MGLNLNFSNINKAASDFTHRRSGESELLMQDVDITAIKPDPKQPRKEFDPEAISELAESIKAQGLIQPILLRQSSESEKEYFIIAGERRFRAVKQNGSKTIRAIIRKDLKSEDLGYLQMAENVKRANLSVVEIAEFICHRIEAGEKQTEVAEKLGLNKGVVAQYASWLELPECLKEALVSKKLGSIQSAYALFKTWQRFPEETEKFIAENEKISQAEAKRFEPKSLFEQTFQSQEEVLQPSEEERENSASLLSDSPDVESDSNLEAPIVGSETGGTEGLESESSTTEEFPEEENNTSEQFESIDNYEEKTTSEENEKADVSGELQTAADEILEESSEAPTYKKPIILCLIEGRECELLYKKKALDGFVFVKYEDGSEDEVPAEEVSLNRIIEA